MPDAPPPPESLVQTVTPDQVVERFERLREAYRLGVYDLATFNSVLALFQFPDPAGVLWTVGATSNSWYRWDGRAWQPATPPARLQMPPMPLEFAPDAAAPPLPATAPPIAEPRGVRCGTCGSMNVGKKFCTSCGARLG